MAPYTKQQLLDLVDTYIPETGTPNIRAVEHRDLETKILDRTDARIIKSGTITLPASTTLFTTHTITFSPPTYTTNYIVILTPYYFTYNGNATTPKINSPRTTYALTGRSFTQCTLQLYSNINNAYNVYGTYISKFVYNVISRDTL